MSHLFRPVALALTLLACSEPTWTVVQEDLDEGLINVWGRSATDVYAVGGDTGAGPIVLHYDGARWARLETGERGDLWWVHGAAEGPLYLGGGGGLILSLEDGRFTRMATPDTGTVFGIWAAAQDDVWAVGGTSDRVGFAWHYDGAAWTAVETPGLANRGLFKVWGTASDDVWIVGAADEAAGLSAALYHWDGSALSPVDSGVDSTLFTVHCQGAQAAAVGGSGTAAIVELEDGRWVDRSPEFVSSLFGVWLTPDGGGWAVGSYGTIARRTGDGWVEEETELGSIPAFHSVWVDETGGAWAAGGQVLVAPLSDGVLAHRAPN